MKKLSFLFKIAVTFLAVALPLSCDSGGGGGGGSSGGVIPTIQLPRA